MLKKKICFPILFLFLLMDFEAKAQNMYFGEDNLFHFGFSLGFNNMDFGVTSSNLSIDGKTYSVDVSTLKPGFSVGIVTDMIITRYLNLRFTPTIHFGERELTYTSSVTDVKKSIVVPSVPVSFPLYVKYSSERYGNIRPYLLAGGGAYIDLGQNQEKPVYLRSFDVFAEVGVGCDIYFSFFKLAPELKLAIGNNDLFIPLDQRNIQALNESDKLYSLALSKLTSRMLTLTFNFE